MILYQTKQYCSTIGAGIEIVVGCFGFGQSKDPACLLSKKSDAR